MQDTNASRPGGMLQRCAARHADCSREVQPSSLITKWQVSLTRVSHALRKFSEPLFKHCRGRAVVIEPADLPTVDRSYPLVQSELYLRVRQPVRPPPADSPHRSTSFHVVGGQSDTVYSEGNYLLEAGESGSQALALAPAQGGFVELTFAEAGHYPFVSHVMVDPERGAHGVFETAR